MPDGMPLDTTPTPAQTETQTAPAPQSTPSTPPSVSYTQEQVNAMMKAQHDSINADWRRKTENKPAGNPPPSTKSEPTPQQSTFSAEQVALVAAQAAEKAFAFGEAIREVGLNSMQASLLRKLQPADLADATAVHEWVKEQAAVFGNAKTSATPAPAAINVPAPISPSAPSTAVPLERDVTPLEMTTEQIHELMRKKGANPAKPYQLSNGREARRALRLAFEAAAQSRRFRVG